MDHYSLTLPQYHVLVDGILTRKLKLHPLKDSEGILLQDAGYRKSQVVECKTGDFMILPVGTSLLEEPLIKLQNLPHKKLGWFWWLNLLFIRNVHDPIVLLSNYLLKETIQDVEEIRSMAVRAFFFQERIQLTWIKAGALRQLLNEVGFNLVHVGSNRFKVKWNRRSKALLKRSFTTADPVNCYFLFIRSATRVLAHQGFLLKLR